MFTKCQSIIVLVLEIGGIKKDIHINIIRIILIESSDNNLKLNDTLLSLLVIKIKNKKTPIITVAKPISKIGEILK